MCVHSRAADESANQAILLTCAVLKDTLLGQIRQQVESLFKVNHFFLDQCFLSAIRSTHPPTHPQAVEAIALLDMLCSFAENVLDDDHDLVRPTIQADGPLAIKEGRYDNRELWTS